jgi:hypothetical protein
MAVEVSEREPMAPRVRAILIVGFVGCLAMLGALVPIGLSAWRETRRHHQTLAAINAIVRELHVDESIALFYMTRQPELDGWGRPLLYRSPGPVHPHGWDLWSVGPNGIDEQGGGDDILVGENVAAEGSAR